MLLWQWDGIIVEKYFMPDMILIRESIQKDLKMIVSKKSPNQLRLVPT